MRWSGAAWRPIPCNYSQGSPEPNRLLVVHVMQGTLQSADSWFRNPAAGASAHFGVGTGGNCLQWVDTDAMSWANCDANGHAITVETAGYATQPMTDAQVTKVGQLLRWANRNYPEIALWLCTRPDTGRGLAWHGLGGYSWCGHPACPGPQRIAQLHDILDVARG